VVGYRRFGKANLSRLQNFSVWWLATDVSGKPIFPVFKILAFGGWLPTFRESQSFPSSKFQRLVVGYRYFGKAHLLRLQHFSIWWLATEISRQPIYPSSKVKKLDLATDILGSSFHPIPKGDYFNCLTLTMGRMGYTVTLIAICLSTLRNISKWRRPQATTHHGVLNTRKILRIDYR